MASTVYETESYVGERFLLLLALLSSQLDHYISFLASKRYSSVQYCKNVCSVTAHKKDIKS